VLQKIGFRHEGVLRAQAFKWGVAHDLVATGVLREEWTAATRPGVETTR
jgi:RimJ/RimL family protein N-acetyltransferase